MTMFGGDSKEDHRETDHSEAVIDPALRSLASSPTPDKKNDSPGVNHQPPSDHPSSMPLRVVEQFQMSTTPRRHFDTNTTNTHPHRLPSPPPPITTMSTSTATDNSHSHSPSPSVSVDRSSNSTPHIRRSPPQMQHQPQPGMYSTYEPSLIQSARHHANSNANSHYTSSRQEPLGHGGYIYSSSASFEHQPRYEHHQPPPLHTQHHAQQQPPQPQSHHPHHHPQQHHPHHDQRSVYGASSGLPVPFPHHVSQHPHPHSQMAYDSRQGYPMPGGQPPVPIVHTDDAATKLTEGIRRRCFNCCTTDTSTWRRSNLSPGKVLCNKCGLFERTHSRPRPDQFPHKRGPLASQTLRGRTPPGANQLPPIAGGQYQYHHQSITPLNTGGPGGGGGGGGSGEYHQQAPGGAGPATTTTTLPGLGAWHGNSSANSISSNGTGSGANSASANANANGGNNSNGNSTGGGESHGSSTNTNGSAGSATGTPLLPSRRSTLDSPRLHSTTAHSSPRDRHFEDLASNAVDAGSGGSRHPPPSPPRSAAHTPPPPAGSAREGAA